MERMVYIVSSATCGDQKKAETEISLLKQEKSWLQIECLVKMKQLPWKMCPVKSEAGVESFDEDQKFGDVKEQGQITTATDAEDEREEEALRDESEQHSDSCPLDVGEQAAFRAASPGGPAEKSDADMSEIGKGDATSERAVVELDQSPLAQSGASPSRTTDVSNARESSPSNRAQVCKFSEQQNPSTATDSVGTRSRTININETAYQNRQARFNRSATSRTTTSSARVRGGRQSVTPREDAIGGSQKGPGHGSWGRGGRGGQS